MRTQRWSVAATITESTTPIAMLTRWRRRNAWESPPVRSTRSAVADHTSRVPSASSAVVASSSSQSSCGTRARLDSVRTGRGRVIALIGVPRVPGAAGGRIEPSSAKTGSRSGGTTPGIAAVAGPDLVALDAVEGLVDLADRRARRARPGAALGDHHDHDVVLGVRGDPRGALLAVHLGGAGLGPDGDLVEREPDQPPRHGAGAGDPLQGGVDEAQLRRARRELRPAPSALISLISSPSGLTIALPTRGS